ncbi:MAG: tRNA 2-selenouridine synthase [Bacteroidia bacterium]|jgi:tRNA 2-selenouridine synthase
MVNNINISEALCSTRPIIDVRSPKEYQQGHIPNAINIPLFTDEERAEVGTTYKQVSKEAAIEQGTTLVNPKLLDFIHNSEKAASEGSAIIHCWRGGMRSQSFAKHLSDNGFSELSVITGGYKAYRNYVLDQLEVTIKIKLLGGFTGSGKTYILSELKKLGHQILDLEGLAHHKGSAFGGIGQDAQPTSEQFDNNLFREISKLDRTQPIWIEDESYSIGTVNVPQQIHTQMRSSALIFIDIPAEERAIHLVQEYTQVGDHLLADSILKLSKRLGLEKVNLALELLSEKKYYEVALLSLGYYDKLYKKGKNREAARTVTTISRNNTNHYENALALEKLNL